MSSNDLYTSDDKLNFLCSLDLFPTPLIKKCPNATKRWLRAVPKEAPIQDIGINARYEIDHSPTEIDFIAVSMVNATESMENNLILSNLSSRNSTIHTENATNKVTPLLGNNEHTAFDFDKEKSIYAVSEQTSMESITTSIPPYVSNSGEPHKSIHYTNAIQNEKSEAEKHDYHKVLGTAQVPHLEEKQLEATQFSLRDLPEKQFEVTRFSLQDLPEKQLEVTQFSPRELPEKQLEATQFSLRELPEKQFEATQFSLRKLPEKQLEATQFSLQELPEKQIEATQFSLRELPKKQIEATQFSLQELPKKQFEATQFSFRELPEKQLEETQFSLQELPEKKLNQNIQISLVDEIMAEGINQNIFTTSLAGRRYDHLAEPSFNLLGNKGMMVYGNSLPISSGKVDQQNVAVEHPDNHEPVTKKTKVNRDFQEIVLNEIISQEINQTIFARASIGKTQGYLSELLRTSKLLEEKSEKEYRRTRHNLEKIKLFLKKPKHERKRIYNEVSCERTNVSSVKHEKQKRTVLSDDVKNYLSDYFSSHEGKLCNEHFQMLSCQLELDFHNVKIFHKNWKQRTKMKEH